MVLLNVFPCTISLASSPVLETISDRDRFVEYELGFEDQDVKIDACDAFLMQEKRKVSEHAIGLRELDRLKYHLNQALVLSESMKGRDS